MPKPRHEYFHIDEEPKQNDELACVKANHPYRTVSGCRLTVYALVLAIVTGVLGFWAGNYVSHLDATGLIRVKYMLQTFDYNQTFADPPSNESNMAWDALYPKGGGFIVDPLSGLEGAGVSVFHQLHCLDALRHLYYAAELGVRSAGSETQTHHHAQHCFDYLRQSIMCAADNTIEPGNRTLGIVTGAGATHRCRDYDGLVSWTEERRLKADDLANPDS